MKTYLPALCAVGFGILIVCAGASAADAGLVTSVYSKVSNGYARSKMPDGSLKREYYALAKGQYAPGLAEDTSIDGVRFPFIAGVVARHLAAQNYYLARDSSSADLLILITWGKTIPADGMSYQNSLNVLSSAMSQVKSAKPLPSGAVAPGGRGSTSPTGAPGGGADLDGALMQMQMANDLRTRADEQNARLLGYAHEIYAREDDLANFAGAGTFYHDMISDIEEERYYVIIDAFDFRAAKRDGTRKTLWSTRVSIRAHGNPFNERFAQMIANSEDYFGRGTGGLLRDYHPEGKVDIGDLRDMGVVPDLPDPSAPVRRN